MLNVGMEEVETYFLIWAARLSAAEAQFERRRPDTPRSGRPHVVLSFDKRGRLHIV
jgi:hypothetical protein